MRNLEHPNMNSVLKLHAHTPSSLRTQLASRLRPSRYLARRTLCSASSTTNGTGSTQIQSKESTSRWGEADFGTLQEKASSRLHRFYVPQPLGPPASTPSWQDLLRAPPAATTTAAAPSPSPASSHTTSTSTSPRRRSDPARKTSPGATSSDDAAAAPPPASTSSAKEGPAAAAPAAAAAAAGLTVVLEGDEARHAARALRLQAGSRVELCDGRGNVAAGTVTGSDKQRVWVTTDGPGEHVPWTGSRWVVAVACTTLKGGRAEWMTEKLTELGAYLVVPLVTERSQAGGKAKFRTRNSGPASPASADPFAGEADGDYQPGRLERVAIAATKQSLRPHALQLAPPTPLRDVVALVRRAAGGGGDGEGPPAAVAAAAAAAAAASTALVTGGGGTSPGAVALTAGSGGRECSSSSSSSSSARGSSSSTDVAVSGEGGRGIRSGSGGGGSGGGGSAGGSQGAVHSVEAGCSSGASNGSGGGGSRAGGGGGGFALVAVAGAPPLAAVLRELQGAAGGLEAGTGAEGTGFGSGSGTGLGAGSGAVNAVDEPPLRVLLVGPEGDFTPGELAALVAAGARPVGLGMNRLRTETAAVALLAACVFAE